MRDPITLMAFKWKPKQKLIHNTAAKHKMNHRPRRFNKLKLSGPTMAVYRLSDVAGDKTVLSPHQISFFFAWSVKHGDKGDCSRNFRRRKLWTVGSFGTPRGTAQNSGYITAKGCVDLQRATRGGPIMQETPSAFLHPPPPEAKIWKCRDLWVNLPNNHAGAWKTRRRICIRAEGSSEERPRACGRANQGNTQGKVPSTYVV